MQKVLFISHSVDYGTLNFVVIDIFSHPKGECSSILFIFLMFGPFFQVEILMKFNADPTIRNNNLDSPLDAACQFGHTAVSISCFFNSILLFPSHYIYFVVDY